MTIVRLSASTLAAATELRDLALALAPARAKLPVGTPVTKTVGGRRYWYLQSRGGGLEHQRYLGPETQELLDELSSLAEQRVALAEELAQLERLHDMVVAGGALADTAAATRVLELLDGGGIFRRGGVVVGTRAFLAFGPLLGFRPTAGERTDDLDLALGVAVGLPREPPTDLAARLGEFSPPFLPVPELDPRRPSTSFKLRGRALRVDFVTPLLGREREQPIPLPAFGIAAAPLRLLDYLIAEPLWAVAYGSRPVLVRIPDPSRFALHKLWLASRRHATESARAAKDLAQAATLLELLLEDRPRDLAAASRALALHRSASGAVRVIRAIRAAAARLPDPLARDIETLLRRPA